MLQEDSPFGKRMIWGSEYTDNVSQKDARSLEGLFRKRIEPFHCPVSDNHYFHLAIACEPLESPVHGSMDCSPSPRAFQYNTSCSFRCAEGFTLRGADTVRCADSGEWTAPAPVCQGIL